MIPSESLALAVRAAREGGQYLATNPLRRAAPVLDMARDVKLAADRAAEDCIVDVLTRGSRWPIVGEERVAAGDRAPTSGFRWIVDPLDGTMNYLQGIPFACVSVALWNDDEPVAGAIYDFDRDEMFAGAVDVGAWLNDAPIRTRAVPPAKAVLCTGFPAGTDFSPAAVERFVGQVCAFRKLRMLGSAALSLAYVAAGRADAYFERDIRIWDVAGGLALVRAAGGTFVRAESDVPHGLTVYAHNGACPWPEANFAASTRDHR